MKQSTRRRVVGSVVAAVVGLGAFAGTANAGFDEFHNGYLNGHRDAPWHTLIEGSARSLDGNWVCISAYNRDLTRAGDPACANGVNSLASHPYCGCALRMGRVAATPAVVRARVTWP